MADLRKLMREMRLDEMEELLRVDPSLVNKGISYCGDGKSLAHPLHRICDGVFDSSYSDDDAVKLAELLIRHGAAVNGDGFGVKQDTPLIAACSLHADEVALFYILHGAELEHQGCMGGTALHWASWTGRDRVVSALLEQDLDINKLCIDHQATPLFWAVHGFKRATGENLHQQIACARLLVEDGADIRIPNGEGIHVIEMLGTADHEMREVLRVTPS